MWWSWPQSGVWWWLQSGILVMAGCFQTIRKDLAHPQERRCQSDYARLQSVIISFILIEDMAAMIVVIVVMLKINTACLILSWLRLFLLIMLIGWQSQKRKRCLIVSWMWLFFQWLCWLDDNVKNEPTLSNCEVIAPGRGNIRPSSKNSPQFQISVTNNPFEYTNSQKECQDKY